MSTKMMLMANALTHIRPLTCAAIAGLSNPRLVPQPPDLIKWVKREGGFVHQAVKIAEMEPYGLGLVASQEIPKGSDIIALPQHIPLQFGSLESDTDDCMLDLSQHVPEELWAMKLGLKLLQERAKKDSFWWPYISNLPESYNVPIFFPGEDIKNLHYAPLLYQINKRCRFLLDFEKVAKQILENLDPRNHPFSGLNIDSSALGWSMSAVSSRAFRLHGTKQSNGSHINIPMMLPLIDMCNHSFNPNTKILQEQESSNNKILVKVIAGTHIKENEPLLLNYGGLNNDFFLLDYGFVIPSNPYDCIELKYDPAFLDAASIAAGVSSPSFSSPLPWQEKILSKLNLIGQDSNLKVSIGGNEILEGRLLAALRVILSNDMELVEKQDLERLKSLSYEAPLGYKTEIAALRTCIALCVIALDHFPTKIMEDQEILKQNVCISTELAVQFRMQKKSVIIDVMRELTGRVRSLSSNESTVSQS